MNSQHHPEGSLDTPILEVEDIEISDHESEYLPTTDEDGDEAWPQQPTEEEKRQLEGIFGISVYEDDFLEYAEEHKGITWSETLSCDMHVERLS